MSKLSDAARAEIAEAVRILREDGVHIHKTYAEFQKSLETKTDPPQPPEDTEGKPPPAKEPPAEPPAEPGKRSLWWGDRLKDEK